MKIAQSNERKVLSLLHSCFPGSHMEETGKMNIKQKLNEQFVGFCSCIFCFQNANMEETSNIAMH